MIRTNGRLAKSLAVSHSYSIATGRRVASLHFRTGHAQHSPLHSKPSHGNTDGKQKTSEPSNSQGNTNTSEKAPSEDAESALSSLISATIPSVADVKKLSKRIPSTEDISGLFTRLTSNLPTAEDVHKLSQQLPSTSNLRSHLANIASSLPTADDLKKLSSYLDPHSLHKIAKSLPSADQLLNISKQLPSGSELATKLSSLAHALPSAEDVRALSSHIPSPSVVTKRVAAAWDEAVDGAVDRVLDGTAIDSIRKGMRDPEANPEIKWDARVRVGPKLCEKEREFRARRKKSAAKALSEFIGEDIDQEDVPIIGIAASGGGCRAMISNLASLEALNKAGFLDGTTYVSGVSGSTWALASLYTMGRDFPAIRKRLATQLSTDFLSISQLTAALSGPASSEILTGVTQRYLSRGHTLSTVDLFGTLLTARLLADATQASATRVVNAAVAEAGAKMESLQSKGKEAAEKLINKGKLSQQRGFCERNELPMPLYTAVSHQMETGADGHRFLWWEFSPYEAGFRVEAKEGGGAWVPIWAFGRVFQKAKSQERIPEQSLGLLLGTFGSAFTATVAHIYEEFKNSLPTSLRDRVMHLLEDVAHIHPISPASFPNIAYKLEKRELDHPITKELTVSLMDSGMDNNLPFPPFLRPERAVDIILVLDASMETGLDPWLKRAESFARDWHVKFPKIPSSENANEEFKRSICSVLQTPEKDRTVIYMPLVANKDYDPEFDPTVAAFCATYNFTFTRDQVDKLSGLAAKNVEGSLKRLREAVKQAWKQKKKQRMKRK
ncbi:hypothetical protein HK104_002617 [Borealophlyctis nickersoniae]|nr:hypothetical protein HK104_002617 [Borealophlyctis nickersoniae]